MKGSLFLITEFMTYYQNSFHDCTCCCSRALLRSQVHTPGVLLLLFGGEAARCGRGKPFCWRGEGLAREGLSSFALEEGALSHLSQKERVFRCLLPETDLLSVLFRRRIKMFATRHPLLPLLSPPTPCCGNGPGCVVFSPAFLGLLFGLMVLEMLCKQLRLCFILSCCLWFISVSRTALQFDHVEYRAVLRVLRAFAAVVCRCWRSTCARQVALVVRAVYFPGSSVGYQRCRHVGA